MCRIFAIRSSEPISVRPAFDRLRKLAAEHKDGWGIATFRETERTHDRCVDSAEHCLRFDKHGHELTQSMMVHIRLASVGTVHDRNNHPFSAGPWVFMHNGTLKNFEKHREEFEAKIAPEIRAELTGETDSERCFALFRTFMKETDDAAVALAKTFRTAEQICDDDTEGKRSAMNFLVSDGQRFYATRRDRTLFAAATDKTACIASEDLLPDMPWLEVPQDSMVIINERLMLSMSPIP
ncbi:MAG: class II glutamine amidotransferase [Archangium sp.]